MPRYGHAGTALMVMGVLFLAGCNMGGDVEEIPDGPAAADRAFLDALVPGTPEAGGGHLLAARLDRLAATEADRQAAAQAVAKTRDNPATVEAARAADTADLNADGLLTTDELIALSHAGMTEEQLLAELESTGYVFEDLSGAQIDHLISEGVNRRVIRQLSSLNVATKRRADERYGSGE